MITKTPRQPETSPKLAFHQRFVGKLSIALLYFIGLTLIGELILNPYFIHKNDPSLDLAGKRTLDPHVPLFIGILINLAGCIFSFFVVYLSRRLYIPPFAELVGTMFFRSGVPILAILLYVLHGDPYNRASVFQEWVPFYILVVYLASLPLDVWLVLPSKVKVDTPPSNGGTNVGN